MKAEKRASKDVGPRAISEDGSDRAHSSDKGGSSDAEVQRKKVEDDLRKAALQSLSKTVE